MTESISTSDDEFEATEALGVTMSRQQVLYDSLYQLESMIDEMEDGVEQVEETWQTIERLLTGNDALAMDRKEFYLAKEERVVPLMQLFRKKPPIRIVDLILDSWPEDVQVSKVTDHCGKTIIFHAIEGGASLQVIESIVKKDEYILVPQQPNRRCPFIETCVFASKENNFDANSKKIIRFLMKLGRDNDCGISPLVATIGNKDISDRVIEFIFSVGDIAFRNEMLKARSPAGLTPLQIALLNSIRSDRLIALLLENEQTISFDVLDKLLVRGRSASRSLHYLVNQRMTERWPVAVLLFELYVRTALIICFVHASNQFLDNKHNRRVYTAIFCFEGYFILKELFEFRFRGPSYIHDLWNVFDIACIVVVLFSVVSMESYGRDGRRAPEGLHHTIAVAGGMVVWSLIMFLRAAFLPFAIFVGGLLQILKTLIPFIVVSALMMFALSFMYFVEGIDDTCCCTGAVTVDCIPSDVNDEDVCRDCSLGESFLETAQFFFSGPERTDAVWLDHLFGLTAVIILLNVVIAIVSDAWEENKQRAGAQFWGYRISFLSDVYSIGSIQNCCTSLFSNSSSDNFDKANIWISGDKFWDDRDSAPAYQLSEIRRGSFSLFGAIDDIGRWSLFDSTPWVEPPYETRIHDANDYYRYNLGFVKYDKQTAEWLSKEDYKKLISSGSFERNLHWASQPSLSEDRIKFPYIKSRPQVILELAIYMLLLPLGLVTCGLFWPSRVRENLFGVGMTEEDEGAILKAIESESRKRASAAAKSTPAKSSGNEGQRPSGYSSGNATSANRPPKTTRVKANLEQKCDGTDIGNNETDVGSATQERMNTIESKAASLERKVDGTAANLVSRMVSLERKADETIEKLDLILNIVGGDGSSKHVYLNSKSMMSSKEGRGSLHEGDCKGKGIETEFEV